MSKITNYPPESRCLESKRFKKLRDGYYQSVGSLLFYEGSYGHGGPSGYGWLAPVTQFGRSPLVWEAHWPGNATVSVESDRPGITKASERFYKTTVSAATGVVLNGVAINSQGQNLRYWKVAYNSGGKHVIVKCRFAHVIDHFVF